jgi:hypothetical protein
VLGRVLQQRNDGRPPLDARTAACASATQRGSSNCSIRRVTSPARGRGPLTRWSPYGDGAYYAGLAAKIDDGELSRFGCSTPRAATESLAAAPVAKSSSGNSDRGRFPPRRVKCAPRPSNPGADADPCLPTFSRTPGPSLMLLRKRKLPIVSSPCRRLCPLGERNGERFKSKGGRGRSERHGADSGARSAQVSAGAKVYIGKRGGC